MVPHIQNRLFGRSSAALAEDLLGRTVPRSLRTLLNVEEWAKDMPDDTTLAEDVDLKAIRRVVSTALPG